MRQRITHLKQRYPVAFGAAVGIFLAAGAGLAAWVIFTGVSGSGAGQVGTSTINSAITLVPNSNNVVPVVPGTTGTVYADVHNVAGGPNEQVLSLTASSIVATPSCNTTGLHFQADSTFLATLFPNGNSNGVKVGTLTADPGLDPACAGASLQVNFTGTTSP